MTVNPSVECYQELEKEKTACKLATYLLTGTKLVMTVGSTGVDTELDCAPIVYGVTENRHTE